MTAPPAPPAWPTGWPYAPDVPPVTGSDAMVVTTDRYASEVGVDTLRSGGNAVDAAVAVSFALAVVNPEAGNVGGSGFMVVRAADGAEAALDYRAVAPRAAAPDMFLDENGRLTGRSETGWLAAGVPGSVMGLWEAHRRFGSLPWRRLVDPAVSLARSFVVEERFTRSFQPHIIEGLRRFPSSAAVFLPGGAPPRSGDTFRQPDLARTLERIRDGGPDGFYRGETAEAIVAGMEAGGGIMGLEDLASYRAVWREPVRFAYRGRTILSMPPPSSGGVTLAQTCRILERFDLGGLDWHGPRHVHLLAEAWKRAYADRNHYLADPDHADVPMDALVSSAYADWRAAGIGDAATPAADVRPGLEAWAEDGATTHFSIVDAAGNAASVTTTLNTWYGSKVVVEGTGVLLNNEMDDFTAAPGLPNHFGLVQGEANRIGPGKRMLSAMAPTIVLDAHGRLLMVVGTPGGSTIITTVFQVLSNVLDHGMGIAAAVNAPRVHHQHLPDVIHWEPGGLPEEVVRQLREMRHETSERDEPSGDVQAILLPGDGSLRGHSDPRRGGVARGI